MGRLIFLTYFYLIASLIHIVLIGLIQFRCIIGKTKSTNFQNEKYKK